MTPLAALTFTTPWAGLVALAAVVPLAAFARSSARSARARALLGLPRPDGGRHVELAALVSVPLLLGLAAAGPALRTHTGRRIRTDAQAVFVLDTSRSMAAAASFRAPTRFQQAQKVAIELRDDAIPEVPSGVASLTTELLPHLFPTPDEDAFDTTVADALGIEKPPPPFLQYGVKGTSFRSLAELRAQGFFDPATRHRVAVLLTDGESGAIDADSIGKALALPAGYPPRQQVPGAPPVQPEPPVALVVVRVGGRRDRIFRRSGRVEAVYRPDPTAAGVVASLAAAAHGKVFTAGEVGAAGSALRQAVGAGAGELRGVSTKTTTVAPYVVLVALVPLALILWRRNLDKL